MIKAKTFIKYVFCNQTNLVFVKIRSIITQKNDDVFYMIILLRTQYQALVYLLFHYCMILLFSFERDYDSLEELIRLSRKTKIAEKNETKRSFRSMKKIL